MENPGRGWPRAVRGFVLSGACLALSLGAHSAGGGHVDVSPIVVLYGLLLAAICIAAADAQRGFGSIVAVMAVSQVVLHLVASGGGHHGAPGAGATPGVAMVAAHAAGALVLSTMLAHGERILWALCSVLLLPLVASAVRGLPVPPRRAADRGFSEPFRLCGVFPTCGATWRGPPAVVS